MFSTQSENCTPFIHISTSFLFVAELEEPKIGISGKGLRIGSFSLPSSYVLPETVYYPILFALALLVRLHYQAEMEGK